MRNIERVWIGMALCLAFACGAEDEAERLAVAEAEWIDALKAMGACEASPEPVCEAEAQALVTASEALTAAEGEDAWTFRAKATADCGGGLTVSCSGTSCNGIDNVGCVCWSADPYGYFPGGAWIQSLKECPAP